MSEPHDLVQFARAMSEAAPAGLDIIRLGDADEAAVIPFTRSFEKTTVHFARETDPPGFVHCNGSACVLCRIGRKQELRLLLPVYSPDTQAVAVLPVSDSIRPKALLPQLAAVLDNKAPVVLFIKREGANFTITTAPLQEGMLDGTEAIAAFQAMYDGGSVKLASVFPVVSNELLASIPAIATRLQLKGVTR